jgi:hypothetical protein
MLGRTAEKEVVESERPAFEEFEIQDVVFLAGLSVIHAAY